MHNHNNLPSSLIAAGQTLPDGGTFGVCRTCGIEGDGGVVFTKWVRDTFTDWGRLLPGEIICPACLFCFDEQSQVLAEKTGKEKLQRMRNYSHIVADGEWFALSKAQKTSIYELLLRSPEVVVIAESGQRHLIFKTQPGWWNYEGVNILPFPEKLKVLYEDAFKLYDLNITKTEIESGKYSQRTFFQNDIEEILALDLPLQPHRGSAQFKLAIYLMQKEKDDESIT